MNEELIIDFTYKEFGDDTEKVLNEYPLTGPSGLRKILGEKYPEFFCKAYINKQFEREFADYSRSILDTAKNVIESNYSVKQAIVIPREHGKSTFCSYAIPMWAVLYSKKKFVYFISANDSIASNFLEKIKTSIEESDEILEDFGRQKGKIWNADAIKLTNGSWVSCAGWNSGMRGLNKDSRPDFIGLDDLEDKKVIESPSLSAKLEKCFNEEIGRLGTYNTDFFYIGTLLDEDSLLAKVMKKPSWKTLEMKRVISFPTLEGERYWDEWRKLYRDMTNENREDTAYKFYIENQEIMTKETKVLWPDKVPPSKTKFAGAYYNVMLDREAFGEDAFWKEDQNEPRNSDDKHFKDLTYWNDLYEEYPEVKTLKLAVDPSEGKGQDGTAYCIGGRLNNVAIVIKDGELRNDKLESIKNHIKDLIIKYPDIDEIIIEENSYKEDGTEQIRKFLSDMDVYRKVTGVRSFDNKHVRIIQLEPDINTGKIMFNKFNNSFNTQILKYHAKVKHDDAADVTALLYKHFKKSNFIMK